MSEDPAPYWVPVFRPYYSEARRAWIAVIAWQETSTGHEVGAEAERGFSTYAEALLASQDLAHDGALFDSLTAANPPPTTRYPGHVWPEPEEDRPPPERLEGGLAGLERRRAERLAAESGSTPSASPPDSSTPPAA